MLIVLLTCYVCKKNLALVVSELQPLKLQWKPLVTYFRQFSLNEKNPIHIEGFKCTLNLSSFQNSLGYKARQYLFVLAVDASFPSELDLPFVEKDELGLAVVHPSLALNFVHLVNCHTTDLKVKHFSKYVIQAFFHQFCGFKHNRIRTLSSAEELGLEQNPFIFPPFICKFP